MRKILLYSLLAAFLLACTQELKTPSWTVDLVTPLAKTNLSLDNILAGDDALLDTINDGSLILSYQLGTIDTNINSLITNGDLDITSADSINLPSFTIPDIIINQSISLGSLIQGTSLSGTLVNGGIPPFIPQTTIGAKTINLDTINSFEELKIETAVLEFKIVNKLPTDIGDLNLTIKNQDPNNLIVNDDIVYLPNVGSINLIKGDSIIFTNNLNDVLFTNLLQIAQSSFNFLQNMSPTIIDTSNGLQFSMHLRDIKVKSLSGIIEKAIPLDTIKTLIDVAIDGVNMKKVKIENGAININLNTALGMPLNLKFYSPNIIPSDTVLIPVNSGTGNATIDLSNKELIFTGANNDTVNSFYFELYGSIPPTNINYTTSTNNNITYDITLDIEPRYLIVDVISLDLELEKDTVTFDFLSGFDVGNDFSLESAKITLGIENSLGIDCGFNLNVLSENTNNSNSALNNYNFDISRATFNTSSEIVTPKYSEVDFEDLANVINIQPNLITIDGTIGMNQGIDNFIVMDKGITISPNIEIPLSFISTNLVLSDTSDIEVSEKIKDKALKIIVQNGYPLNTNITLNFLDVNNLIIDSVKVIVPAGNLDEGGRINTPQESISNISFNTENLQDIKKVHYLAQFETSSQEEYNKIYSDYIIDIQIIGEYKTIIGE